MFTFGQLGQAGQKMTGLLSYFPYMKDEDLSKAPELPF
jgi:hypothetical protein